MASVTSDHDEEARIDLDSHGLDNLAEPRDLIPRNALLYNISHTYGPISVR